MIWSSRRQIIVFISTVLTLVTVFGAPMYLVEGLKNEVTNIPHRIYWAIVTPTTVGYGDIAPKTTLGRFVASVLMLMGLWFKRRANESDHR